jgi:hypothetical protein
MAVKLSSLPPNIYLNNSFTFDESKGTATLQPAVSTVARFQPFLTNPDKYFCSVGRFSVTGSCIPMLVADIDETQGNPNVTTATVTIYQPSTGLSGVAPVVWVPENSYSPVPGPPNGPAGQDISGTYYYCTSYGGWAAMISTAMATAQAALVTAGGVLHTPGAAAPQLSFNASLGITQLTCVAENYNDSDPAITDYVQIWVNGPLAIYFGQYPVDVGSRTGNAAMNTRIRVFNQGANLTTVSAVEYLTMSMETQQALAEWCSLTRIAILSDLPILQETIIPSSNSADPNALGSQNVLIDFCPDLSAVGSYSTSAMIYNAGSVSYRQYSFLSSAAISSVTFRIVWYDGLGRQFPLLIRYGAQCLLKLIFARIDQFVNTI